MNLVSVVIPTKNRPDAVADAVASVLGSTYQEFEIIVVDQSASDATRDALVPFCSDARFHYTRNLRGRPGVGSSRNLGIALSSGAIIAHIDDDVTVTTDWMERIVAEFDADPGLRFIAGKLTAPFYDPRAGFTPASDPGAAKPPLNRWTVSLDTAGANFAMRRDLFDRVGGYDEYFGPGTRLSADDGLIALRISRSGAKWKASSAIEVVHTHGFRPAVDRDALLKSYQVGNGGIFGRVARRGDIIAMFWFLGWQLRDLLLTTMPSVIRGQGPSGLGWVRDRLIGFYLGFWLPPRDGFVSGSDLQRLHDKLRATPAEPSMSV